MLKKIWFFFSFLNIFFITLTAKRLKVFLVSSRKMHSRKAWGSQDMCWPRWREGPGRREKIVKSMQKKVVKGSYMLPSALTPTSRVPSLLKKMHCLWLTEFPHKFWLSTQNLLGHPVCLCSSFFDFPGKSLYTASLFSTWCCSVWSQLENLISTK